MASVAGAATGVVDAPAAERNLTLGWFVRQELRRVFRLPFDELATCLLNLVLVCVGWYVLPQGLKDWLFSLRAPQAFPIVLCFWMLADTPATNVFGCDSTLALRVLDSRRLLRRFLWAKHLVLGAIVGVICSIFAVSLGVDRSHYGLVIFICLLVFVAPLGTLAVASWQGLLLPYHQLPVRWRWDNRHLVVRQARWLTLILLPYVSVPFIASAVIYPALGVLRLTSGPHQGLSHPSATGLVLASVVAIIMSTLMVHLGHAVAWRLARWRRHSLAAFLRNSQRG